MRGCITKRKSSWAFVIDIGKDPKSGKRKQKWKSGFATKKEAEIALANVLAELGRTGEYTEPSNEFFGDFLLMWLEHRKNQVRPGTFKTAKWLIHNYIIPNIGAISISKLAPIHLQSLYDELRKKLSTQSIVHCHRTIKMALEDACTWGKIPKNVANLVKPPKIVAEKFRVWDEGQLRTFLEIARSHRLYIAFLLAASTGMRQGEILGLRWKDIDFEKATLSVSQALARDHKGFMLGEPKTSSSRRTIALPLNVIRALKQHRKLQLAEKLAAERYEDHGLVVQTLVGTPVSPRNFARVWYSLLKRAGVPKIRFHDLRHTHATLMLKQGTHPKIVSERLGHSSIQVTLDTYSHLLPNMQAAAAESFGKLLEPPGTESEYTAL